MKILALDIETYPAEAYVWSLWGDNVPLDRLKVPDRMACFAAKWLGDKRMHFHAEWTGGREAMVEAAWNLLEDADALLHYNGNRFDIPHLNRAFVELGLGPPAGYRQIDLYQVVKRRFKFVSNKLAHVAPQLGLEGKAPTGGFQLWVDCLAGDPKARKRMERYNRQDVRLLEQAYERVLPWIPSHPNRRLYDDHPDACPTCGAEDQLHGHGITTTRAGKYRRYRCQSCGATFRSAKRITGSDVHQEAIPS